MARAFGLPGNRGQKAHNYFVTGHAHASTGKPPRKTDDLSRACARAYKKGYDLGMQSLGGP